MATSGTTAFTFNMVELFEEAFERAAVREMRTGYDFRTAARSYNMLTIDWQNRGYNLWTVTSTDIDVTDATNVYELPADTADVVVVTVAASGSNTDYTIAQISLPTWASQTNKTLVGRPTQVLVTRNTGTPSVTLWPVPDNDYTMRVWRTRRIEDSGTGVNTPDVPYRFFPALAAGLAYYIALKLPDGAARLDMLKATYEEQFTAAADDDRDKATMKAVPYKSYL